MSKQGELRSKITAKMVEALKAGTRPWSRPWVGSGRVRNVRSKRPYQGINTALLALHQMQHGLRSNVYGTFNQWKERGLFVKARPAGVANGEWGCTVIFFQQVGKTVEENGEAKRISFPLMRYYTVFAADQVTGAEEFMEGPAEPAFVPHDECEKLLTCSGAEIVHGGEAACYSPGNDRIMLPPRRTFKSPDAYYATALHELAHWTGHESRLNRLAKLGRFGSDSYAMEELVAEMASCYMMGYAGIPIVEGDALAHHASYVANWLQVLKKDEYAVFTAATAASAASDYVLKLAGVVEEEVEEAAVAA